MKLQIDWQYIRISGIILLIALLISGLVIGLSGWREETVTQDFSRKERQYNDAKRRYEEADKNRALYERYLEHYLDYAKAGYIGNEQRLNWIERLQNIDQIIGLPQMRYEINPREAVELDAVKVLNNKIRIYASDMQLHADLLHENDLARLFSLLTESATGFYIPAECKWTSKLGENAGPVFSPAKGNIEVECMLKWVTVEITKS